MKRREFLGLAAFAAPSLPGWASSQSSVATKKVIVLGAGLAGLVAGYELAQAGHDVTIVEARRRPGGRIRTLHEPFSENLHAETGALFVPSNHVLTRRYARLFGLVLEPALPLFETRLFYVGGQRIASTAPKGDWPFDLTAEEKKLGRRGMWEEYVTKALAELGDVTSAGWPPDARLEGLDRMSAAEFLRSRGASPAALAFLRVGYLDLMGDGIESYSALQMLRRVALAQTAKQRYIIRGGADLLPKAFAGRLGARIWYEAPVVGIEPGEKSANVVIEREGRRQRLTAEHIVCTIPFAVLKRIKASPPFSSQKQLAIEELPYTSVARVFLQFSRKAWRAENLHILTSTDLPMKWIFEHTVNQPGRRGILEAQAFGADARQLAGMAEGERIAFALSQLEQIFPGVSKDYERGASKCWDEDPWARGAFAYFRPGQMLQLEPHLARAEGRVHFAGDHTSVWSGWMQGAIESGLRAAREVSEAA